MENCLVKELKVRINNNNLPVIDTVVLRMVDAAKAASASVNKRYFVVGIVADQVGANLKLKNIGGNFCDDTGTNIGNEMTINTTGNKNIYISVNTQAVWISNKKYLKTLKTFESGEFLGTLSIDLEDLAYCSGFKQLQVGGNGQTGNLYNLPNLETFDTCALNATTIVGDVSELSHHIHITTFQILSSLGITGDFATWAPYRSAGNVSINCVANQVKCNGIYLSSGTHILTFDGQGGVVVTS